MRKILLGLTIAATLAFGWSAPAAADMAATLEDIERTYGFVPTFILALPPEAIPGAWAETRALEIEETTLPTKVKALIELAVAAYIPCQPCVWAATAWALSVGATEQEIKEAVALAALVAHWSVIVNGAQIGVETFMREFGATE